VCPSPTQPRRLLRVRGVTVATKGQEEEEARRQFVLGNGRVEGDGA